jgi:hypothetical protein
MTEDTEKTGKETSPDLGPDGLIYILLAESLEIPEKGLMLSWMPWTFLPEAFLTEEAAREHANRAELSPHRVCAVDVSACPDLRLMANDKNPQGMIVLGHLVKSAMTVCEAQAPSMTP